MFSLLFLIHFLFDSIVFFMISLKPFVNTFIIIFNLFG